MSYGTNLADARRQIGAYTVDPQGRQARRPTGRSVIRLRAGHQPRNRSGARPHGFSEHFARADEVIE